MCLNKSSSFGWKGYILLSKFLKEGYIFSPNYSKFVLHMNKHGTNILPKCPPGPCTQSKNKLHVASFNSLRSFFVTCVTNLGGNMARFTQFPIMITRSTIIYEIISPGAAGSSIYV